MARSVSLHTVVLASLGSGSAALLVGQSGLTGTVVGAALVPVVVAAVTEIGRHPLERLARRRRPAEDGAADPPRPAAGGGRGWERWAAGSAVALAVGALAVAVADGTQAPATAPPQVIVREIQTTTYAAVPAPPRTVTVVQRVEVPVPTPDDGERPAEEEPTTDTAADEGAGAAPPPAGEEPDTTAAEPPTPPATSTDAATTQADPAATDPAAAVVKERVLEA
jgi:hypothetical protein